MAGTYTPVILPDAASLDSDRTDLLTLLADQRAMLAVTVRAITEEQARTRTTVSDLTLGGLIKHVAAGDRNTAEIINDKDENAEFDMAQAQHAYELTPQESFADALAEFEAAGAALDAVFASYPDIDELIPQPTAPWQPERIWWSVRRMMMHRLREIAHHSGHADIIREALDGQTTMAALFSPGE